MIEVKAPNQYQHYSGMKIFLAGSIEMGSAETWQDKIIDRFKDYDDIIFLNPRRDDWDSSWEQTVKNPHFFEQVNWETEALHSSDLVVFYFDPNTKSPITLLELGMMAEFKSQDVICCCPDGFWRQGNVEYICDKFGIPMTRTKEEFESLIEERLLLAV
jgi:hypothetical protein